MACRSSIGSTAVSRRSRNISRPPATTPASSANGTCSATRPGSITGTSSLAGAPLKHWKYERYIRDYLACVAAVDDNVGRLLDYLETSGLAENTIVVYTSDQGFFLGDHNWFDKRFMYEESLRMPFLIRYPGHVQAGAVNDAMILNVDFAPTLMDCAGLK